jgi:eukaryotic-like serine/threonine-protein kinase
VSSTTDDRVLAGRYRLEGLLGVGGMAQVHRAWDLLLRRYVAVKVFRPHEGDPVGGERFDNEVRTLARLSHPALVAVYDTGTSGAEAFVVLQLVEGGTLRKRMAEGPMPPEQVRDLGARLAEALAHVHESGVVHRDVKPSNILLDRTGTAFLADFGLARSAASPRLTNSNMVMGTAAYLAPEQVRGEEVGPAADVYALGLVLLECLTGRREYDGGDVESAVARLHRPPDVPRDLPPDLVRLLSLMTSLTPRRRLTAAECAATLQATTPRPLLTTHAHVPAPPPRRRTESEETLQVAPPARSRAKLLIASAVVLGAIGTSWAVSTALEPSSPGATTPTVTSTQTPVPVQNPVETSAPTSAPTPAANTQPQEHPPVRDAVAPEKPDKHHKGKGKDKDKAGP